MINTTLKELLKAYQESNPETTTLKLSNIEHLVMNEVIQMPYFKEAVSDLNGSEKMTYTLMSLRTLFSIMVEVA